jgi:hypothetical protein
MWQLVGHESGRHARHQRLAASAQAAEPSRAVHRGPVPLTFSPLGLPGCALPARTFRGAVSGRGSSPMARWIAAAAVTASSGLSNTENVEAPSPLKRTTLPPAAVTSWTTRASWRTTAAAIASGSPSHNPTDPTTSVSTNERGCQPSVALPARSPRLKAAAREPRTRTSRHASAHAHSLDCRMTSA